MNTKPDRVLVAGRIKDMKVESKQKRYWKSGQINYLKCYKEFFSVTLNKSVKMASLSIIESTSAIRCCSEIASTSSNEDVQVFNDNGGNNNTQYHTQMDTNSPFPERESVTISFRNLKYTVNKLNFSKRRFGEYCMFRRRQMQRTRTWLDDIVKGQLQSKPEFPLLIEFPSFLRHRWYVHTRSFQVLVRFINISWIRFYPTSYLM